MIHESPCLINLKADPCERYNVAEDNLHIFQKMQQIFEIHRQRVVPAINKPKDEDADPANWNGVWVNWGDRANEWSWFKRIGKFVRKARKTVTNFFKCLK